MAHYKLAKGSPMKRLVSYLFIAIFFTNCSSVYDAAARGALLRGSLEEAEKFMVLGDFTEEERERVLITWCQQQKELATIDNPSAMENLATCFESGPSAFAENLELAQLENDSQMVPTNP
jgi:hypothetical protein